MKLPGNFKGWYIKTPQGILPSKYIMGMKQTPNAIMDLDPRRTGEGLLIRNVLPYTATTIDITFVPMSMSEKMDLQRYLPETVYIKLPATYWNEKYNEYVQTNFYIPEISWETYTTFGPEPVYIATPIQLIGYGEKR